MDVAARAGAMTHHSRGRRAVLAMDRTQAALARMRALGRRNAGAGMTVLPRAVGRQVLHRAEPSPGSGYRAGLSIGRGRPEVARRVVASAALRASGIVSRRKVPLPAVGAVVGVAAIGARATLAVPRVAQSVARPDGARRGEGSRSGLVAARGGPLLLAWGEMPHRATLAVARSSFVGGLPKMAGPAPQHADAPGFHRTVRHRRSAAGAGDVYLDKNLVGYHLAAAITAEQTRAAARPGISGSGFNSSMAVLRPAGAGS